MASDFRALSIQQPWASAIACGPKRVENRTWSAPPWIIGQTIALHASKGPDWDAPAAVGGMGTAAGHLDGRAPVRPGAREASPEKQQRGERARQ